MVMCPACGARNRDAGRPCDWCGAELPASGGRCLVCGSATTPPRQYCRRHLGAAEGRLLSEQSRRPSAWVLAAPARQEEGVGAAVAAGTTVRCPACGEDNPEGTKFCGHCGRGLAGQSFCPACGNLYPPGLSFCQACGAPLGPPAPLAQPAAKPAPAAPKAAPRPAAPPSTAAAPVALQYAGFWQRFLAFAVDLIVAALATFFLTAGFGGSGLPATVLGLAAWWGYFLLSNSLGRLAGKALFGIQVIDPATGAEPGFAKGALRTVGLAVSLFVSILSFGMPFLIMIWDERRRTLPDLMAGTVVVRTGGARPGTLNRGITTGG